MDAPFDKRNSYGWHQDDAYNLLNKGENAIVTWIPMTHVDSKIGSLKICKYSHKAGPLPTIVSKPSPDVSMQRIIEDKYLNEYEIFDIEAERGDVLFGHMYLIHRSGENSSSKIRFTATARHHKMLTNEYYQKMYPEKNSY